MESHCFRINLTKVVSEIVDEAVIIIDLDSGAYYQLVESGVDAWLLFEKGISAPQFLRTMCSYYSDDPSVVEQSAVAFLEELKREEILVLDGATGIGNDLPEPFEKKPMGKLQLEKFTNMSDLLLLDPIHDVD